MSEEVREFDETPDPLETPATSPRRPYARPELVRYGALQEVTRAYTQTRSCAGAACANA